MKKRILSIGLCLTIGLGAMPLSAGAQEGYQINTELDTSEEITLTVAGPGTFGEKEETMDLISGLTKPGYQVVIDRWNELYPNVKVDLSVSPWDNWKSFITTACLDGEVDVILHGATLVDLAEDLTPYLEQDPEYQEQIYATANRQLPDRMSESVPTGIPTVLSPAVMWLDTEIFEHFGVELPSDDWTVSDMLALAEQLTGTDPVTGEQVYGFQFPWTGSSSNLQFSYWLIANCYGAEVFKYGTTVEETTVDYFVPESIAAFQTIIDLAQYESPEAREGVSVSLSLDGTNNWAISGANAGVSDYFTMLANGLEGRYVAYNYPVADSGEYEGIPSPADLDQNLSIYKESDAKEWAWEFIKFMTTDEVAVQYLIDCLNFPNNAEAKELMASMVDERTAYVLDRAYSTLPDGFACSSSKVHNSTNFGATGTTLYTAVDNLINGRMTAEEAAQYMQDYIDEYMGNLS